MDINDQKPTVTVMDVVVSAGNQEVTLTSTLNFTDKVEKILDINANICNIGYHIVGNKIIVQGILHKQVFYINYCGKTKFQTEQLPFATFIEMHGVKHGHQIRIEGRVEQMQRQLCRQGGQLKQKITLVFEGSALEPRRYVVYYNQGYRYRIREILTRKECRIHENRQIYCNVPVKQIRSVDVQINNVHAYPRIDKVVVHGDITRRLETVAGLQNHYMEEEYHVEYSFDVPGAKPDMNVVIQGENDGKFLKYASPVIDEDGAVINQEINLCFYISMCRYKQLSLLHDEGPMMLLQRPVGEGTFIRRLDHDIELGTDVTSVLNIEGRLYDLEEDMIMDKMLIRGMVEYKIQYLTAELQDDSIRCVRPFIVALDLAGADAKNLGEIRIIPLLIATEITGSRNISVSYKVRLMGQVFEQIIMPVSAQQLQLL